MTDVQDRTVHIVEGEHAEGLIRWFYGEGGVCVFGDSSRASG